MLNWLLVRYEVACLRDDYVIMTILWPVLLVAYAGARIVEHAQR